MNTPATPPKASHPKRTHEAPRAKKTAYGAMPETTTSLIPPWDFPSEEVVRAAADRAEGREAPAGPETGILRQPRNPAEWVVYALAWIAAETDTERMKTRWAQERKLRNAIGVSFVVREPVQRAMVDRIMELLK